MKWLGMIPLAVALVSPASAQSIGDDTARYLQRASAMEILVVRRIVVRCQEAGDNLTAANVASCSVNLSRWAPQGTAPIELLTYIRNVVEILKDLEVVQGLISTSRITGTATDGPAGKAVELRRGLLDRMDQLQIALDRAPRI